MSGKGHSKLFRKDRQKSATEGHRVLIADDLGDYRLLLRMVLDATDFDVVGEARDGREAIDMTRSFEPDAIILDLAMPEIDGLHVIPTIRAEYPNTKILVHSGFDANWLAVRVMELGADSYVQKSGDTATLTSELTTLCS